MQTNNYISLQQARLTNQQALIAAHMAQTQQTDSRSARRLSIVATVFLPLSFATVGFQIASTHKLADNHPLKSWLSINTVTPLWLFFVIACASISGTTLIVILLKWLEKGQESWPRNKMLYILRPFVSFPKDIEMGVAQEVIDRPLHV